MDETAPSIFERQPNYHLAWWSASLGSFRLQSDESIVERLNLRLVEAHFTARADQLRAWRNIIPALRQALMDLPPDWQLLLEYPLLRLGRRLDVTLVTDRAIIVMEFKSQKFDATARTQAEDYALDLQDFHSGSRHHPIVPILVANDSTPSEPNWPLLWTVGRNPLFEASKHSLQAILVEILRRIDHRGVDIGGWERSAYRPVPTIIEAARMLYAKHGVLDIKTARAEKSNLTDTTAAILDSLAEAKEEHSFIVVFITGIPGAGKTLCGLDAVFSANTEAAFLTGTLPMVYVLKEALAQDAVTGFKGSKSAARHKTKSKIQSITGFLKDHRDRVDAPVEHLIVFDEAQRAWSAEYGAQKFNLWDSEAGIVLDIMNRHTDYAVIVGLVGNGQEINTGEAGLSEWGNALSKRPQWKIRAARNVVETLEHRQRLFDVPPPNIDFDHNLHLNVAIRHIRSTAAAPWVDAVLRGAPREAASIAGVETEGVPFFVTRQLTAMRKALRARMGGSRRAGLVCSSGAKRLVADGLWPNFDHMDEGNVANWFLKNWPPDVRSSKALEIPATEFACQGLELDYVGLCWGGDFIFTDRWIVRKFSGTKWQYPKKQDTLDFCRNTYRVLLTRARYDTIIWIPEGDSTDPTREPELFDQTVAYLLKCGATMLQDVPLPLPEASPTLL